MSEPSILEQLLAQRARLMLSLGSPERSIEFENRRVERFSPAELLEAIYGIDQQIALLSGGNTNRTFVVASSSGLSGCNQFCCGGGDVRSDRYEAWR
jgi:hypothetical protein